MAVAQIVISGSPDVDGVWVRNGEANGKPRFTNVRLGSSYIEWTGSHWLIKGSRGVYPGPSCGESPPECDGENSKWGGYALKDGEKLTTQLDGFFPKWAGYALKVSHTLFLESPASRHTQHFTKRVCEQDTLADVEIRCGSHSIEAHACVLVASPVFEKMLKVPKVKAARRIIEIDGFAFETVRNFLEVLYTGACYGDCDWGGVLIMSDKYDLPYVVHLCLDYMRETLSAKTVASYLSAINKTLHLPACQVAKISMVEEVQKEDALLRAVAGKHIFL